MNTAARAPKSPAKNNATLSFMVQDWPPALLLFAHTQSGCLLQLQGGHVTSRRRKSQSSCTRIRWLPAGVRQVTQSWLLSWPSAGVKGGQSGAHDSSEPLLGFAASPPPQGYFWGSDWRRLLRSAVSVWSSWGVWKGGDQHRNNQWQLDTVRVHGNVRVGWDRKDRGVSHNSLPHHPRIISCKWHTWGLL